MRGLGEAFGRVLGEIFPKLLRFWRLSGLCLVVFCVFAVFCCFSAVLAVFYCFSAVFAIFCEFCWLLLVFAGLYWLLLIFFKGKTTLLKGPRVFLRCFWMFFGYFGVFLHVFFRFWLFLAVFWCFWRFLAVFGFCWIFFW